MSLTRWITETFFGGGVRAEKQTDGSYFYLKGNSIDFPYSTLFEIFRAIPHLRFVIEKKSSMWSNAGFKVMRTDTEEDEVDYDHHLNEVLTDPNSLQSWRQMLFMTCLIKSIAGISFLRPAFGLVNKPSYLVNLKVVDFETYETVDNKATNFLKEDDVDKLIHHYLFYMRNGGSVQYKPSELLALKDVFFSYTDDFSRITSNIIPIQNIYKALVSRGEIIESKGGVGILSGSMKDGGMSVPLVPEQKENIEKRLADRYGLMPGKNKIIVTDVPLKFQHTIYPTSELKLFEEIVDDFNSLCDGWGVARELFVGDAAYASTRKQAETDTYTNTIMPEWSDFFGLLNKGLNTAAEKRKIVLDTSHIACLQKNEKEMEEVQSKKSDRLLKELEKGIINIDSYKQQMGYVV